MFITIILYHYAINIIARVSTGVKLAIRYSYIILAAPGFRYKNINLFVHAFGCMCMFELTIIG